MSRIRIYKNGTVGNQDGTVVSSGTWSNPIQSGYVNIPSSGEELSDPIQVFIRCDDNFETIESLSKHASILLSEGDKWRFALTEVGLSSATWGNPLDILTQVIDQNVEFWVQARVLAGEEPGNDKTDSIGAQGHLKEQES